MKKKFKILAALCVLIMVSEFIIYEEQIKSYKEFLLIEQEAYEHQELLEKYREASDAAASQKRGKILDSKIAIEGETMFYYYVTDNGTLRKSQVKGGLAEEIAPCFVNGAEVKYDLTKDFTFRLSFWGNVIDGYVKQEKK